MRIDPYKKMETSTLKSLLDAYLSDKEIKNLFLRKNSLMRFVDILKLSSNYELYINYYNTREILKNLIIKISDSDKNGNRVLESLLGSNYDLKMITNPIAPFSVDLYSATKKSLLLISLLGIIYSGGYFATRYIKKIKFSQNQNSKEVLMINSTQTNCVEDFQLKKSKLETKYINCENRHAKLIEEYNHLKYSYDKIISKYSPSAAQTIKLLIEENIKLEDKIDTLKRSIEKK